MSNVVENSKVVSEEACEGQAGRRPSKRSLRGLDWLNFFLADVQTGVGPFLAIYLAGNGWTADRVGYALTAGGLAGIATQTPAGALVDRAHAKRTLIAIGTIGLAAGAMLIALLPKFSPVLAGQALIGGMSSVAFCRSAACSTR